MMTVRTATWVFATWVAASVPLSIVTGLLLRRLTTDSASRQVTVDLRTRQPGPAHVASEADHCPACARLLKASHDVVVAVHDGHIRDESVIELFDLVMAKSGGAQ